MLFGFAIQQMIDCVYVRQNTQVHLDNAVRLIAHSRGGICIFHAE